RDSTPLEAGDVASYRRDNLPPRLFQRLKRGQYSVQDELDLHGATAAQAETLLRQFLLEAHAHEYGCVRIIHGKGLQSDGGAPVLKNLVDRLLRLRNDVLAFHSAPTGQGGTGAVLVLLARR
ncbi:TPA: Smr/MutS family protein, partial [Stenotrophomonas maltophilia]|nr:Smr/MutS family protein [Stenotrophomonas maltophilia]